MSPRKTLEVFSRKGKRDYVRVVRELVDGKPAIRVLWKEGSHRRVESFDDTRNGQREAVAFADGVHERLKGPITAVRADVTLRELHGAYILAKESEWAPNTVRLSHERWRDLELFAGRDTLAATVQRGMLDELKKVLLAAGRSPNQVKHVLKEVVREFTWAVEWDLIPPTKLTNYTVKFTKAVRRSAPVMAEFSLQERERLLAVMDPRHPREWRFWVLQTLFGFCGPRQTAARHLEIDDVEFHVAWTPAGEPVFEGRVRWRAETNKTDADWWQPIPSSVAEALWVAIGWRQYDGYGGRFVFYGVQRRTRGQVLRRDPRRARAKSSLDGIRVDEKPWTYSAYNGQLRKAEARAGIAHIKYRAAHGSRRGVAGDVHASTGSLRAAADYIGDRSTKVVSDHYVLTRQDELRKTANTLEAKRNEMLRSGQIAETLPSGSVENQQLTKEPAVGIEPTTARSQGGSE